jgi:hypothetical protein
MAYKDFNINSLADKLLIEQKTSDAIFPKNIPFIQPSQRLELSLLAAQDMLITTEKAVCEYIISPILIDIKQ